MAINHRVCLPEKHREWQKKECKRQKVNFYILIKARCIWNRLDTAGFYCPGSHLSIKAWFIYFFSPLERCALDFLQAHRYPSTKDNLHGDKLELIFLFVCFTLESDLLHTLAQVFASFSLTYIRSNLWSRSHGLRAILRITTNLQVWEIQCIAVSSHYFPWKVSIFHLLTSQTDLFILFQIFFSPQIKPILLSSLDMPLYLLYTMCLHRLTPWLENHMIIKQSCLTLCHSSWPLTSSQQTDERK